MPRVLVKLDSARAAGLDVTADQYPYIASATSLSAVIPPWAHAGGTDSMLARLRDPVRRRAVRDSILATGGRGENMFRGTGGADGILVASVYSDSLRPLQGKRVGEIARSRGADPLETLLDLLVADNGRVGAIYFSMNEDDLRAAMVRDWVAGYVRELRLLTLEQAVRKMTSLPAQRVGLTERGLVRPGLYADLTVFDPATVGDRATFEDPHQPSVGIVHVFVNGRATLRDGALTAERPGRGLRGPGHTAAR
jgi:N-acyl-D-aspartate/D-glutamate deacylase